MASPAELTQLYRTLLGREPDQSGIDTYSSRPYGQVYSDIVNSPERQQYLTSQGFVKPVDQATQSSLMTQAQNENNPVYNAAVDANNADYKDLADRIRENSGYARASNMENQNSLGLLQSGQTGQQDQFLQRDMTNQLNRADIARTLNNATLAMQNAQNITSRYGTLTGQQFGINQGNAAAGTANLNLENTFANQGLQGQQLNQNAQSLGINTASALQQLLFSPAYASLTPALKQILFQALGFNYVPNQ